MREHKVLQLNNVFLPFLRMLLYFYLNPDLNKYETVGGSLNTE